MEFKYRAVNNVKPETTLPSLSPVTYLPDRSLQMESNFSGIRLPLTGEEALLRELEKEVIRREILRRLELEEEVRRELEIERELGISMPRPLNIQGLVSQWSKSTVTNPVSVGDIGASQPSLVMPPTEIKPSPEISNNDKVIVLAKPDPELYNAKRKVATLSVTETEPSALDLKKKQKQEWTCGLCEIKATSESGLNAHLNGRKHKIKEARQNWKICKSNKESGKIVNAKDIETTMDTVIQHRHVNVSKIDDTKTMDTTMIHNEHVNVSKIEEQLMETAADNNINVTKFNNENKSVEMS